MSLQTLYNGLTTPVIVNDNTLDPAHLLGKLTGFNNTGDGRNMVKDILDDLLSQDVFKSEVSGVSGGVNIISTDYDSYKTVLQSAYKAITETNVVDDDTIDPTHAIGRLTGYSNVSSYTGRNIVKDVLTDLFTQNYFTATVPTYDDGKPDGGTKDVNVASQDNVLNKKLTQLIEVIVQHVMTDVTNYVDAHINSKLLKIVDTMTQHFMSELKTYAEVKGVETDVAVVVADGIGVAGTATPVGIVAGTTVENGSGGGTGTQKPINSGNIE